MQVMTSTQIDLAQICIILPFWLTFQLSKNIFKYVQALSKFKSAHSLCFFFPSRGEPLRQDFIGQRLKVGKKFKLYLPPIKSQIATLKIYCQLFELNPLSNMRKIVPVSEAIFQEYSYFHGKSKWVILILEMALCLSTTIPIVNYREQARTFKQVFLGII